MIYVLQVLWWYQPMLPVQILQWLWPLTSNALITKVRNYYKSIILVAKESVHIKVISLIHVSVSWIPCKVITLPTYKTCGNNNLKDLLLEFIWLKWCTAYLYVPILVWKLALRDDEPDTDFLLVHNKLILLFVVLCACIDTCVL